MTSSGVLICPSVLYGGGFGNAFKTLHSDLSSLGWLAVLVILLVALSGQRPRVTVVLLTVGIAAAIASLTAVAAHGYEGPHGACEPTPAGVGAFWGYYGLSILVTAVGALFPVAGSLLQRRGRSTALIVLGAAALFLSVEFAPLSLMVDVLALAALNFQIKQPNQSGSSVTSMTSSSTS